MKKKISTYVVFTMISIGLANAQVKTNYQFGLKFGGTLSRFIEDNTKNNYWLSYVVGLSMEQRFTQRFSISYDIAYSRQGNIVFLTNPGMFHKVRTKYDYLTFPISLRYRLKRHPIILLPGIQISRLLTNQIDFLPKNGYTNNNIPNLKKTDIGYSLGLGVRFSQHLFGEAKFYQSFKTLFKGYSGISPVTGSYVRTAPPRQFNQVISMGLIYYPFAIRRSITN